VCPARHDGDTGDSSVPSDGADKAGTGFGAGCRRLCDRAAAALESAHDRLARIGGATPKRDGRTPRIDRTSAVLLGFVAVAVTVFVLAGWAASIGFVFGVPWLVALLPAVVIALVVLAGNRMLIVSVVAPTTPRAHLGAVLGGSVMALFFALLPAGAMVLLSYQPALDSQRIASITQDGGRVGQLEQERGGLQEQVAQLVAQSPPALDQDPEVMRLQGLLTKNQERLDALQERKWCERSGCKGAPGPGPNYRDLTAEIAELTTVREDLGRQLETALGDARSRNTEAVRTRLDTARADLGRVGRELDEERRRRADQAEDVRGDDRSREAQLARLGAVPGLLTTRPIAPAFAFWVAVGTVLQMLPVLLKFVCGTSPTDDAALADRLAPPDDRTTPQGVGNPSLPSPRPGTPLPSGDAP
jgi:hypothetical protein